MPSRKTRNPNTTLLRPRNFSSLKGTVWAREHNRSSPVKHINKIPCRVYASHAACKSFPAKAIEVQPLKNRSPAMECFWNPKPHSGLFGLTGRLPLLSLRVWMLIGKPLVRDEHRPDISWAAWLKALKRCERSSFTEDKLIGSSATRMVQ